MSAPAKAVQRRRAGAIGGLAPALVAYGAMWRLVGECRVGRITTVGIASLG